MSHLRVKARVRICGEKRFLNWCYIIPLRWIYTSRPCPLNESARLSRSQYENVVPLLTIKPRQRTATDSQNSAPYCYCQSNVGIVLLLSIKRRQRTASDSQNSAPYCYCQSNVGTLLILSIKRRHPNATDNQISVFKSVFSRCCLGNCLYILNIILYP